MWDRIDVVWHMPGWVPVEHGEGVLQARFLREREVKHRLRGRQAAKGGLGELDTDRCGDASGVADDVGADSPITD